MSQTDFDWCVLNTDGGSRGNPGPAGAAFVLSSSDGSVICSAGRYLGEATNNFAEYDALVWGLQVALARGCRAVEIRMDSELIVRQMTGIYRVKNEGLRPLFVQAQSHIDRFDEVRFVHIPREENADADRLANEAMDTRSAVGDREVPNERSFTQRPLF